MTSHEILKSDLLDIVFDNRNKQYGAYSLRRHYVSRLGISLGVAISGTLLLIFLINPGAKTKTSGFSDGKPDVVIMRDAVVPKPKDQLPVQKIKKVEPIRKVAQASYTNLKMVENVDPAKALKSIDEIRRSAISNTNTEGPLVPETQVVVKKNPIVNTGANNTNNTPETKFEPLEKGPEFPGGAQAWINFLNRYLQTPADLEAGEKKQVLVSFWVAVDGSVTGFEIIHSGGTVFDNEVIRVLKRMPKWKPALQNGHTVATSFTQPVTFVGIEQ